MGIDDLPDPDDRNFDDWDLLIGRLEGRLLWDDDWDMADRLDTAPEAALRTKREIGILDDDFVALRCQW